MRELSKEELSIVSGGWQSRGATRGDMGSPHEGRSNSGSRGDGNRDPRNERKGAIDKFDGRGAADLGIKIGRYFGGQGMTESDVRNMRDSERRRGGWDR